MRVHLRRFAPRVPLPAGVLEFPYQFLLLRVDRHRRLARPPGGRHPPGDVTELPVPVGVRPALPRLAVRLQAVPGRVSSAATARSDTGWSCRVNSSAAGRCSCRSTAAATRGRPASPGRPTRPTPRPARGRSRPTACGRRRPTGPESSTGSRGCARRCASSPTPDGNRRAGQPGRRRHRRHAAPPDDSASARAHCRRIRSSHQRRQGPVLVPNPFGFRRVSHPRMILDWPNDDRDFGQVISSRALRQDGFTFTAIRCPGCIPAYPAIVRPPLPPAPSGGAGRA